MRILSLDLGTTNIKAIELDVSFGRFELVNTYVVPVIEVHPAAQPTNNDQTTLSKAENASPEKTQREILTVGQKIALKRLISEQVSKYDRLVVSYPNRWVTSRLFHFPTKDRRTIQSSIQFEIEDDIPFSIENTVIDFAVLRSEGTSSNVFAALSLKSDLTLFLAELQMIGIDPDMITTESWGYSHLLRRALPPQLQMKPICVVNIGADQTGIHVYIGSQPILSHTCTSGGDQITQAIATTYHLPHADAEQAKVNGAFLITETHHANSTQITPEQKQFSEVVAESLGPLIREIKQIVISCKSTHQQEIKAVYITGGSSLISNLHLYLEEELKIPVFNFSYIQSIVGQSPHLTEAQESHLSSSVGIALSSIKPDRNSTINFRYGEYAKKGGAGIVSGDVIQKMIAMTIIAIVFIYANLFVQYQIISSKQDQQEAQLEKSMKTVLGALTPSVIKTYINSPSTLKSTVEKELAKYRQTSVSIAKTQSSALDVLNKVSAEIPTNIKLDVNVFQLQNDRLKLTGTVQNAAQVDIFMNALKNTKLLTDLSKDKVEDDVKKHNTRFEISSRVADRTSGAKDVKNK